jgi:hypothetical protein
MKIKQKKTVSLPITFSKKNLLVVEGYDEIDVCDELLKKLNIFDIEIYNVEGEDNFHQEIEVISQTPGFKQVKRLGIVRDAKTNENNIPEQNKTSAFKSACDALEKIKTLKFPTPTKVGDFTPLNGNELQAGVFVFDVMIEQLFLASLREAKGTENERILKCAESFVECLPAKPKQSLKAISRVFLSGKPKIIHRVGLAAREGYWNFDAESLTDLKNFLENFR